MTQLLHDIEADPVEIYRRHRDDEADDLAELPAHCQPGLVRYILLGIKPGSFLCAILAHEFDLAEHKADEINRAALPAYAYFVQFSTPPGCSGSSEKVRAWCEQGGLLGRASAK